MNVLWEADLFTSAISQGLGTHGNFPVYRPSLERCLCQRKVIFKATNHKQS
jgi:hypothetical protein